MSQVESRKRATGARSASIARRQIDSFPQKKRIADSLDGEELRSQLSAPLFKPRLRSFSAPHALVRSSHASLSSTKEFVRSDEKSTKPRKCADGNASQGFRLLAELPLSTACVGGCLFGVSLLVFEDLSEEASHSGRLPSSSFSQLSLRALLAGFFWFFLLASAFVPKQTRKGRLVEAASECGSGCVGRSPETDLKYRACTLFIFGTCSGFFASLLCWGRLSCLEAGHYLYILLLVAHHGSEYLFVKTCHPKELSFDAFLLNNSPFYATAILLSLFEIQFKRGFLALVFGDDLGLVGGLLDSRLRLPSLVGTLSDFFVAVPLALWAGRESCAEGAAFLHSQMASLFVALEGTDNKSKSLSAMSSHACPSLCARPWVLWRSEAISKETDLCLQTAVVVLPLALSALGFFVSACGLLLRISGFATLASNFTHQIRRKKTKNHALVNWGIYGLYRHPAYAGWFWWAVGSQLMLLNVLCFCIFFCVSFSFFRDRILFEEQQLLNIFGSDYEVYRQRVRSTGIPGLQRALDVAEANGAASIARNSAVIS